jgi:hypothetical protein
MSLRYMSLAMAAASMAMSAPAVAMDRSAAGKRGQGHTFRRPKHSATEPALHLTASAACSARCHDEADALTAAGARTPGRSATDA